MDSQAQFSRAGSKGSFTHKRRTFLLILISVVVLAAVTLLIIRGVREKRRAAEELRRTEIVNQLIADSQQDPLPEKEKAAIVKQLTTGEGSASTLTDEEKAEIIRVLQEN